MNLPVKKQEIVGAGAFVPEADKYEWQEGQQRELPKAVGLPFR